MSELLTLTDANWQETIGAKAALILLSNGDGLRSDFTTAFKKAAAEHSQILFAQIDPTANPQAAEHFKAGSKPVMIGVHNGEVLVRRVRPWGSDVVLAIQLLEDVQRENTPMAETNDTPQEFTPGKPVEVTDATFQQEVIDYSHEQPVLVDFWAEWCGPCRMVAPIMEKLAGEFAGQVRIAKVDTDANPGLTQAFRIMSIPTIMAFKSGKLVFNQPGAYPEEAFRDLIRQLIELEIPQEEAQEEAQTDEKTTEPSGE